MSNFQTECDDAKLLYYEKSAFRDAPEHTILNIISKHPLYSKHKTKNSVSNYLSANLEANRQSSRESIPVP